MSAGNVPPGLQAWLGRDLCGTSFWTLFQGSLGSALQLFNARDFRASLSGVLKLLAPVVRNPHVGFDCGTAVASALILAAQCCEQLNSLVLGARMRQLAAIFASFDYQMKGQEFIDQSPWPMQWMDSMEGILWSMGSLKQYELSVEPWRGSSLRNALAGRHGQALPTRIAIVSVCDYDAGQTPLARLSKINAEGYAKRHGYDIVMYDKAPVFSDPLSSMLTDPISHRPAAWSKVDAILMSLAEGKHDWVMWKDCDSFFMDHDIRLDDVVAVADHAGLSEGNGELTALQTLVSEWLAGPQPSQSNGSGGTSLPAGLLSWYDDLFAKHWQRAAAGSLEFGELENTTLGWKNWLFEERAHHLIASEDGLMLNTGNLLVRASTWSWQFFQKVRAMTFGRSPVMQHPWWEQTAMVYLLQLPFSLAEAAQQLQTGSLAVRGFAPACLLLSQKHINTYPPLVASSLRTHEAFSPGDYIISFSGCKVYSSQEVCNQLFLTYFFQVHDARTWETDPGLLPWL